MGSSDAELYAEQTQEEFEEDTKERLECFTYMDAGEVLERTTVFEFLTRVADNCNDPIKSQKLLELAEASNQPLGKGIEL